MSSMTSGVTYTLSTTPISTGTLHQGEKPKEPPLALIATRAVQCQAGWLGQVIIDREIIWETDPKEEADDAVQEVNHYVISRVKALFSPTWTP